MENDPKNQSDNEKFIKLMNDFSNGGSIKPALWFASKHLIKIWAKMSLFLFALAWVLSTRRETNYKQWLLPILVPPMIGFLLFVKEFIFALKAESNNNNP